MTAVVEIAYAISFTYVPGVSPVNPSRYPSMITVFVPASQTPNAAGELSVTHSEPLNLTGSRSATPDAMSDTSTGTYTEFVKLCFAPATPQTRRLSLSSVMLSVVIEVTPAPT